MVNAISVSMASKIICSINVRLLKSGCKITFMHRMEVKNVAGVNIKWEMTVFRDKSPYLGEFDK